jgi:hypothetical protein
LPEIIISLINADLLNTQILADNERLYIENWAKISLWSGIFLICGFSFEKNEF